MKEREGEPDPDRGALEQIWQSFADTGDFEANVFNLSEETTDGVAETVASHLEEGRLLI